MPVDYEKEDRIAVIRLNRPEALNAIDPEMAEGLSRVLAEFRDDDALWVGIVTGAGNAFSVGADVATMLPLLKQSQGGRHAEPPDIMRGLKLWKPLIAAVNGAALGGGLELALACDIRIASENAVFGFPEVTLGLIPGWGGTQRISRAVPLCIAAELLYTGRPISANRALQYGLVNKVAPRAELMSSAMTIAQSICKAAPLAVRAARQALMQGLGMSLEKGLELESSLNGALADSADFDEGCRAYLEKRKPVFRGQ